MKTTKTTLSLFIASLCAGVIQPALAETPDATTTDAVLGEITVTGTREGQALTETPASISVIDEADISTTNPTIRRKSWDRCRASGSTSPAAKAIKPPSASHSPPARCISYLEDGIPTRSTGFFNHNALYEINVPQAGGIEVTKGPGSALQGSDAIGGVINVLTQTPPLTPEASIALEGGSYGWARALLSAGNTFGDDGVRGDLNLTHTDGWRDATDYDRQSLTARWDHATDAGDLLKSVFSYSYIDQQTAGSSAISRDDYLNTPTINYTPISYRKVGLSALHCI